MNTNTNTTKKLTRAELIDAAVARVVAEWPNVDVQHVRELLDKMSDYHLATVYAVSSSEDYDQAARMFSGGLVYDAADLDGIAEMNPND